MIPRIPEIGEFVRGTGVVVSVEEVPPPPQPPPTKDYIFAETTARVELRLRGVAISRRETLNDFYGLESSARSAAEEARSYAAKNGIGPDSDLKIVAVKRVEYFRARPVSGKENFYAPDLASFDRLQWGSGAGVPEAVETVAWSSRTQGEEGT